MKPSMEREEDTFEALVIRAAQRAGVVFARGSMSTDLSIIAGSGGGGGKDHVKMLISEFSK